MANPSPAAEAKTTAELVRYLAPKCQRGIGMTLTSSNRRYTFYWLRRAVPPRLAVRVRRRKPLPRFPVIEALAAELAAVTDGEWRCPWCGKPFKRRGKQRYCTPAHAARARKNRWLTNVGREERLAKRRQYETALRARHIVRNRAIERARREDAERRG